MNKEELKELYSLLPKLKYELLERNINTADVLIEHNNTLIKAIDTLLNNMILERN